MQLQNDSTKMFGAKLVGVKEVQVKIAVVADQTYGAFLKGDGDKENFRVPVILSGMGTGKSSMLDRHLESLRQNCNNSDLLELLAVHRKPLVLSITFNSKFTFDEYEKDDLPELIIARRLLASYFGISDRITFWRSMLSSSGPGVFMDTVKLISRHHKRTHGLDESAQIAILINVDELNQISSEPLKADEWSCKILREIAYALRTLSMTGIDGTSPVFPLLAGTAHKKIYESLKGSGISLVHASMLALSSDQVLEAVRGCGVPEEYFSNPDFLRLLDESGGIPRVIRIILDELTVEYNPLCIEKGREAALEYLKQKLFVDKADIAKLLSAVVLGEVCDLATPIGSNLTFDHLQESGTVWMKPFGKIYQVTMPLLSLRAICETYTDHLDARRVLTMLNTLKNTDWVKFEHFCAHFSAYKMKHLALSGPPRVTMGDFYGVDMAPEVAELQIELSADKQYDTEVMKPIDDLKSFPMKNETSLAKDKLSADTSFESLLSGKVIVNLKGAPVDCMMVDPLSSGNMLVRAICISHTTEDLTLTQKKLDSDHTKALNAVKGSVLLNKAMFVTVHISNRKFHKNLVHNKDSVVIGQDNLCDFFGPVLSRGMWSNTHLIRKRQLERDTTTKSKASRESS